MHASLSEAGFACGIFILGTLFACLVIGRSIEQLGMKKAFVGLGFGTYMSCAQAVAIKVSPSHRRGLATSTFFIFMDLGVGFGPFLLGSLIPVIGFRGLYVSMASSVVVYMVLYYFLHGRTAKNGKQLNAKTSSAQ